MKYPNLKEELVRYCQLMATKGLVAGTEGNVSARDRDGTILMTPSGVNKGEIEPEMLVGSISRRIFLKASSSRPLKGLCTWSFIVNVPVSEG